MSESKARELKFGIDRLVTNGRRIFGWGWVAHPTHAIDQITLLLAGADREKRLPVNSGLARADVERAFPRLRNAGFSGFVVTGYAQGASVAKLVLELRFDDGDEAQLDVTRVVELRRAGHDKFRELLWLARAVGRRLRRGDFGGIVRRARAQNFAAPSLDDLDIVQRLLPRLGGERVVSVVFDHNLGGGANQYRRALIDERLAGGSAVMLCTYNLPTLDYRLQVFQPGGAEEIYRISSFLGLERMLTNARVEEIFLNSVVSFDEPLVFADWISSIRAGNPKARLIFAVHDYFSACPSFVLLNADGRYCGIPDIAECTRCLKRHQARYVALSPPTEIGPWRALWGRCLEAADEVRCFSDSSRRLLLRAYPTLDRDRITVIPHRVDFAPARLPRPDHAASLVIGILGQISVQKGALVLKEMLAQIDRDHLDIRVVVIGELDIGFASERLKVTGVYRRDDLPDLIEAHGVNLLFFPSICPETFSYVTEEMIRLGLPIVAFDLGAPGERLRNYANARLCGEITAAAALATLIGFHEELAAQQALTA
jgi:glycosyltransferase involved in cell wall biosynthesis